MKTTISATHLIAAAVIAGAFATGYMTGPAFADEGRNAADATVKFDFDFTYHPDELNSTPKATKLLQRLENKVKGECGMYRKMSVNEREFARACVAETMKTSIAKFGSEAVAQAYKARADG